MIETVMLMTIYTILVILITLECCGYMIVGAIWKKLAKDDSKKSKQPFFEYPCDDKSGTFENLRTIYHGDFQNDYSDWVDGLLELQRESGQASMAEGFCENQMGYMFLFYLENEGLIEINRDKINERCESKR